MSDAIDALGRALHHAGLNVDRTTLGVAVRNLEQRGYHIAPASTPQFHVQPAKGDHTSERLATRGSAGGNGGTKGGSGRV